MMYTAADFRKMRTIRKKNDAIYYKNTAKKMLLFSLLVIFSVTSAFLITSIADANQTDVIMYQVSSGETLWNIAAAYNTQGMDVREFIFNIKKINNLQSSAIQPGQQLKIPIYR